MTSARQRDGSGGRTGNGRNAAHARLAVSLVAAAFGVPPVAILSRRRGRARTALARQVAMYLLHVGAGCPVSTVGVSFGRDRTTAAYACARIEDRRDDEAFDRAVAALDWAVGAWRGAFLPGVAPRLGEKPSAVVLAAPARSIPAGGASA